jgi:hypothetical protein
MARSFAMCFFHPPFGAFRFFLRGFSNHFIGVSLVPKTIERDTWGMRPRMARSTVSGTALVV